MCSRIRTRAMRCATIVTRRSGSDARTIWFLPHSNETMIDIRSAITVEDLEAVRALCRAYEPEAGSALCFQGFEAEVAALPGAYAPPTGRLLLAVKGTEAVGCVALRALQGDTCEMKRLFMHSRARGLGLGR